MPSLDIGLSALTVSQRNLDLIGQNISNAATPGYHRQALGLVTRVLGGSVGEGVDIGSIRRLLNPSVEQALNANAAEGGRLDSSLSSLRQIEGYLTPRTGDAASQLDKLFNQITQLGSAPNDTAQRSVVIDTASSLATAFNTLSQDLGNLSSSLNDRVVDAVDQINTKSQRVADLNQQIQVADLNGNSANELRDQRDQLVTELSGLVGVRATPQPHGVVNLQADGIPLVVGTLPFRLQANRDASGASFISAAGSTTPLAVKDGTLGGLLSTRNGTLADTIAGIDDLAREIAFRLDSVQATGLGLNGPQSSTAGVRGVTDPTVPLASAGLGFPVQAGSLFLSVTDQGTGQRTLTEIPFDPATQSLTDLAGAITTASGGQVQGSVTSGNALQLQAQSGLAFDFAGRLPTDPQNVVINGTATPSVSGVFSGTGNGSYNFQIAGSGTVGVTPGLTVQVRDLNNNVVATVNVGAGYIPGTPLSVGNGLSVSIGAGTTNNGSFSTPVVGQPDTTGALAALGVNSLFSGNSATTLKLRPDVASDPGLLAGSRSGQAGDSSNLQRLIALRDQPFLAGGTETFQQAFSGLITGIGSQVQSADTQQTAQASLAASLQAQQQSVSGVDQNEEIVNLVQAQRSFAMAAQYISVVNKALDEVINIIR
jgi:flagellar hook-associated protein FlgK